MSAGDAFATLGGIGDLPEPDYDNLDLNFDDLDYDDEVDEKHKATASGGESGNGGDFDYSHYILGTLIVRVVAARKLEPLEKGGWERMLFGGGNNTSQRGKRGGGKGLNPYASVNFGGSTQRTSEVHDSLEPIWPRGETMFMDVSLPLSQTTWGVGNPPSTSTNNNNNNTNNNYDELTTATTDDCSSSKASSITTENTSTKKQQQQKVKAFMEDNNITANNNSDNTTLEFPNTVLTVAVFHAAEIGRLNKHNPKKNQPASGDSDDYFLGMTTIDLTQLLTGKTSTFDEWLPLSGGNTNNTDKSSRGCSSIRIVCEYEPTDPAPTSGDIVQFTKFAHPADLYPLVPSGQYRVKDILDADHVILSYTSREGWECSFVAHRYILVCVDRHHGAIEFCQDELASIAERLAHSPMVHIVTENVQRVPDDGLLEVGANAIKEGASLLSRWLEGGVDTAIRDVVFATNWDGRFTPDAEATVSLDNNVSLPTEENDDNNNNKKDDAGNDDDSKAPSAEKEPLPNMPACPITGEPMRDPVVAADGHTYERTAIARWLLTSDKSPLTGGVLHHKELVPNYSLLSSVEESAKTASAPKAVKSMMRSNSAGAASLNSTESTQAAAVSANNEADTTTQEANNKTEAAAAADSLTQAESSETRPIDSNVSTIEGEPDEDGKIIVSL